MAFGFLREHLKYEVLYVRIASERILNAQRVIQGVTGGTDQTSGGCSLC